MKAQIIRITLILLYLVNGWAMADERDAYIFQKVDYQQGLSNSAVICLFQDNTGLMWFGTYDGVNCYDGKSMEIYRSDFSADKTLSNNVIHRIQQADSNCLWISSYLGVNRFSAHTRQVVSNYEFGSDYVLHSNHKGNTWVVGRDWISYYNTHHHCFVQIEKPDIEIVNQSHRAFVTDDGNLWLFPNASGDYYRFSLNAFDKDTLSTQLTVSPFRFHPQAIEYIFYQNGNFCFYDSDKNLFMHDISRKSTIYIRNIANLVEKYGDIKGVVPFYEDIVIAFRTNGLIRLRTSRKYEEEIVNRNIRIFDIYKDPHQGILWVGSDGQGAMMYSKKYAIATNLMLKSLSPNLSRQVRSILTDEHGGLWFGTKGDGLLHIRNYRQGIKASETDIYSATEKQQAASYIKWNTEFQVYSLVQSRFRNGFWVGAGASGLLYYSFSDGKLHAVSDPAEDQIVEVHSIFEENDSILYLTTAGVGFRKVMLSGNAEKPHIKTQKRYHFYYEQQEVGRFFAMISEGDSLLWLGSREKGLIRFNRKTEEYQVMSLNEILHKSVDDILSLQWHRNGQLYVGTTSGLVCVTFNGKRMTAHYIGREQGLLNDMIHGVLEDADGFIWLGTNRGLIKYNPENGFSHAYYYSGGMQIGEFSDDAYYRCPYSGSLFFGGIDGLLYLDEKMEVTPEFYPDILLRKLMIGRSSVNWSDYTTPDGTGLQFKGSDASFSLSFVVPDYVSGADVEYSYMLEGYDKDWGAFSGINEASYFKVPSGGYVFRVRYKKDVFDTKYKSFSIPVYILPPWYRTLWAYTAYALLALLLVIYIGHLLRKYFRHEQMVKTLLKTESQNATCVTDNHNERELINNFTLIYQACDQLRTENISYEQRNERIEQIREVVMSQLFLPGLEKQEFRFSSVQFSISGHVSIRELSAEVLRVLGTQGFNTSSVHIAIPDNVSYPVYKNMLRCILYYSYLYISGKNTSGVTVDASEKGGRMFLAFQSQDRTVKGLYEALSALSTSPVSGKESDEVFRLQMMQRFVLSALEQQGVFDYVEGEYGHRLTIAFEPAAVMEREGDKKVVLLLEDRDEMEWLISDLLSDEYIVRPVKSVQLAFDEMRRSAPALFLVDMLMYAEAEGTFMEYVNKNRSVLSKTAFIPMLTWKASSSIQRELILWSDSYVVFPYDIPFLKEVIHKAIYGKQEAKQIYMEDLSGLTDSIVCTTTEQAGFIRKFLQVVESNLDREDLGSTFIADQMAMSSRQFYRKFKEISGMPPGDLIKNYRMKKAAALLLNEELSIQDVISDVGISSRSYFYKEFTRKFGMTPKDYREKHKEPDNSLG